jgi:hypothetical protein
VQKATLSPLSLLLFNAVLKFLARAGRQEKEIKEIRTGREEVKLSLFVDDMILHLKDPKDATKKKRLGSENTFSKVAEYKTSIQNQ